MRVRALVIAVALVSTACSSANDDMSPVVAITGTKGGGADASTALDATARDSATGATGATGALDAGTDGQTADAASSPDATLPPLGDAGPPGTWINVTPPAIDLADPLDCGNYGVKTVQVDPSRPSDVYALFFCQGIWKSTDYGATWSGPINTGTNGATVGDCAGGITLPPSNPAELTAPTIYASCIRGTPVGFWSSTNGGLDWTNHPVLPNGGQASAANQQFYPPVVDPYDPSHLLMAGHAVDLLVESENGGMTWSAVATDPRMQNPGGTGGPEFLDTGSPATTRTTWLWLASDAGGVVGTWRTTNGGAAWVHVDKNEHTSGANGRSLVYQPDSHGVVYMAGSYSALGSGILRSTDYGVTWTHEGSDTDEAVIVGTSRNLYSMYGWAIGAGQMVPPALQVAASPGTAGWTMPATPPAMYQGPAEAVSTSDGVHDVVLVAAYNAGLWRYVEP